MNPQVSRFIAPENDYLPLGAVDPGALHLTVAVVVPVYNRPELLRRTLAGIAAQRGYPADLISVVVADDGSEEDISPVVAEAAARLQITAVRQDRDGYGAGRARTLGARSTDADVVLFVDADCLPDPELVAGHMEWHHRADNLVVVGSRQHVDSTEIDAEALATGAADIRRIVKGDDAPDEAFLPEDWRRRFYRRTARLRFGNEAFRTLLTGNSSVRREHFLGAGGFSPDFRRWGGEDTELGWRLFSAGLFFVPVDRAAIYHQDQEESHPEEGWRDRGRDANAGLIRSKIPHRFYRSSNDPGPFEIPKVSVVVAPAAGARAAELLGQLQDQRHDDWEACFPLDPGFAADDPRLHHVADDAGADEQRILRAIAAARGEYVAMISGAAGLHPRLLERTVRLLDTVPRASRAAVAYSGLGSEPGDAAWGHGPLPAFALVRRREWAKVLPGAADLAEAWDQVRRLSWEQILDDPLVTLPPPEGVVPVSVTPSISARDRAVEAGRRSDGIKGRVFRAVRRLLRRDRTPDDDRPVLVHLGDPRSLEAVRALAPWARVETSGRGAGLVIGGGAVLDGALLARFREMDSPRMERIVVGASVPEAPDPDWADQAGTCPALGLAAEADAARLRALRVTAPITVTGHPADHPEAAAALLAELEKEIV